MEEMKKLDLPQKEVHLLICMHERDQKASCGPKFSQEQFKELKTWIKENDLKGRVKLTQTSCLGVCPVEGHIVLVYPGQEYYQVDTLDEIKELIEKKIA